MLNRGVSWRKLGYTQVGVLVGAWGMVVTGCSNASSIGGLAAAGGQSGFGGAETGSVSEGGSRPASPSAPSGGSHVGVDTDHPAAGRGGTGSAAGGTASGGSAALEGQRYPGRGFIVHEWGTDTVVVGSDGSLQRGLHHEEEDLPAFVYDRMKAGTLIGSSSSPSVTIKMETPVTYFYSPTALSVTARVEFPKGVLTQWYPGVADFRPVLAQAGSLTPPNVPALLSDPTLDPQFPFVTEMCRAKYRSLSGGLLNWGNFSVHARGAAPAKPLADAPLERFGWSHARAVDANLLEMPNGESERFLFYRGLGEFSLPVTVQSPTAGTVSFNSVYGEPVPQVFVLNVSRERGAFVGRSTGIAAGATLTETIPTLEGAPTIEAYAEALAKAVTQALDATGLYHDEAVAMVNTWQRQWFRTPGVRALYLLPQSWTEQSIPLSISPKPDAIVRVMLVRVELITQEQESADVSAVSTFATDAAAGAAYFSALGRFAEPRLRRALQVSPSAAAQQYLSQIAGVPSGVMSGE